MTLPDNLPAPRGAPEDDQDREGWRVSDERAAEWVMRKLARFRERLTEQERLRAEYVGQLEDWWQEATGSLRQDIAWAEGLLTDWAFRLRHEDPDAKTQALPSGRVSTRWVPPHPQARDAGAVAAVLARAQHPAYERVVRARVDVDNRELAKIVRIADEWRVTLSCGCETSA
jgi:phage host-nuclease inhibitor protein Gam